MIGWDMTLGGGLVLLIGALAAKAATADLPALDFGGFDKPVRRWLTLGFGTVTFVVGTLYAQPFKDMAARTIVVLERTRASQQADRDQLAAAIAAGDR